MNIFKKIKYKVYLFLFLRKKESRGKEIKKNLVFLNKEKLKIYFSIYKNDLNEHSFNQDLTVNPGVYCVQNNLLSSFIELVNIGYNYNYLDENNKNLLTYCILFNSNKNLDFINYLLELDKKKELHKIDYNGLYPINYISRTRYSKEIIKKYINKYEYKNLKELFLNILQQHINEKKSSHFEKEINCLLALNYLLEILANNNDDIKYIYNFINNDRNFKIKMDIDLSLYEKLKSINEKLNIENSLNKNNLSYRLIYKNGAIKNFKI